MTPQLKRNFKYGGFNVLAWAWGLVLATVTLNACANGSAAEQVAQEPHRIASKAVLVTKDAAAPGFAGRQKERLNLWQNQWQRWQKAEPQAYRFVYQRDCYCAQSTRGPFMVQVQNGTVLSVERIAGSGDRNVLDNSYFKAKPEEKIDQDLERFSLSTLMQDLRQNLARQHVAATVQYDAQYGFARAVMIDFDHRIADEEYGYRVLAFEALRR